MLPAHGDHEVKSADQEPQHRTADAPSLVFGKTPPQFLDDAILPPVTNVFLNLGRGFGHALAALLVIVPSLIFVMWLTLVCADFLALNRFGPGLSRYWYDFSMRVSLGVLLPPFFIAGMGGRYPWNVRLMQAFRAAIITFLLYAVCFFFVGWLAFTFYTSMQVGVVPELLRRMGPWVFCLLLWVSYRLTAYLLPPEPVQGPPPFAMRLFSSLALLIVASLLMMAMAPLGPLGMPSLSPDFYDVRALPQDVLLYVGTAVILFRRGWGVFRPAWVILCIIGPFATAFGATPYPLPWQVYQGAVAALALLSCVCLYTPSSRRWLQE